MVDLNKEYYFDNTFILNSAKKQIILINTGSDMSDHISKLTGRYNKKYTKIPAYTINREGVVYEHLNPHTVSKIFDNDSLNKKAIVIALENVGWLDKDILDGYCDWKGKTYHNQVAEIPWRGKKYWAKYTDEQFLALTQLIDYLCIGYSINKRFIGNNVLNNKSVDFDGIINRSNFSKSHYDLTPAFEFENFNKEINN